MRIVDPSLYLQSYDNTDTGHRHHKTHHPVGPRDAAQPVLQPGEFASQSCMTAQHRGHHGRKHLFSVRDLLGALWKTSSADLTDFEAKPAQQASHRKLDADHRLL